MLKRVAIISVPCQLFYLLFNIALQEIKNRHWYRCGKILAQAIVCIIRYENYCLHFFSSTNKILHFEYNMALNRYKISHRHSRTTCSSCISSHTYVDKYRFILHGNIRWIYRLSISDWYYIAHIKC